MAMGQAMSLAMAYDTKAWGGGNTGHAQRVKAQTFEKQALDAEQKIGLGFDDFYGFLYRRSGAELQRRIVHEVAASHPNVRVLDAFETTARLGCTFSSDGVHYVQRVRSIIGLELLDIVLRELFNETVESVLTP
jgi:hypothetical protein